MRPRRSLLRRVLTASAANVAPGGATGAWQWLLPGLVVVVVAFAGLNVRWSANLADQASLRATSSAAFTGAVDHSRALTASVIAAGGRDAQAARQERDSMHQLSTLLGGLDDAAPGDAQVAALRTATTAAAVSVKRVGPSPASRAAVAQAFSRLSTLAGDAQTVFESRARAARARERGRLMVTLVGGLILALLLMWSFWAKRTRLALEQSERRFRSLLGHSTELVAVVDDDQRIRFVTPVFERRLGYADGTLTGTPLSDLVHPDDRSGLDWDAGPDDAHWRVRGSDGMWHDTEAEWVDLRDDRAVGGYVVTMRDVSDRNELKDQLHWQAFHDALTGLPNRSLFGDRVTHALGRMRRYGDGVAVLFVDLDDFKAVNDSLGHGLGDGLLREFAQRLGECARRVDTAARLGGDEFAILVEGSDAEAAATAIAARVHESLKRPVSLGADEVFMHASVGIAFAGGGATADELIRNADIAMYAAKTTGKGRSVTFEPSMHSAARKRLRLSGDLRGALRDGQLYVKYQPLVRLSDGRMVGAEALARWTHETLGEIPPDEFIPLAEETGLIIPIGRFVLDEACCELRKWQVQHPDNHPDYISVNLSARQFQPEGQVVEHVEAATRAAGIDPSHLMLEITESVLMHDREAIVRDLTALRALGVRIAIDDFGTGYSALSYLRQFPIDTVKMDRSFVHDLGEGNADSALIRSVVELGEALNMKIVAEGIEGQDQLDSVTGLRCDVGQGFFFSPPLNAEGMDAALRAAAVVPEAAVVPDAGLELQG